MAWDPLERGKAAEKRHSAAKHAQRGVGKRDRVLERGQEIERSHNRAKNNPRWRKASKDRSYYDDTEYAGWRKRYFKLRPELDPQSETSKWLEFFGMDEPYRQDSDSYDYRAAMAAENPTDANNIAPVFDDVTVQSILEAPSFLLGGSQKDNEATRLGIAPEDVPEEVAYEQRARRAAFLQEHGREPEKGEIVMLAEGLAQRLGRPPTEEELQAEMDAFEQSYGRPPQPSEVEEINIAAMKRVADPRSRDEKMAGMFLGALSMPMAGFGEEAVAGAMSLLPGGGTYDQELAKARAIEERAGMFERGLTPRNIASGAMSFAAIDPIFRATMGLGNLAVRGGRMAAGLTPQATSLLGRGAAEVGAGATGWTAWEAADEFGSGKGGFKGRLDNIDNDELVNSAITGGLLFPAFSGLGLGVSEGAKAIGRGAKKVGKKSVSAGKKAVQALWKAEAKPKPLPYTPGDIPPPMWPTRKPGLAPGMDRITNAGNGTVRSDINRALARQKRPPGSGTAAGMTALGLGAAGIGTGLMARDAMKKNRNRK